MYRVSYWTILLSAILLMSYHLHGVEGRFSFALPGKWGHNKRTGPFRFSLPGKWGNHKRSDALNALNCEGLNPDMIYEMHELLQQEAQRLNQCLVLGQVESDQMNDLNGNMETRSHKQ